MKLRANKNGGLMFSDVTTQIGIQTKAGLIVNVLAGAAHFDEVTVSGRKGGPDILGTIISAEGGYVKHVHTSRRHIVTLNKTPKELNPKLYAEIFKGVDKDYYWRARHHSNKKIMATSGEGYRRKSACLHGLTTVFGQDIAVYLIHTDENGDVRVRDGKPSIDRIK